MGEFKEKRNNLSIYFNLNGAVLLYACLLDICLQWRNVKLSFFERKERAKEKRELVKETVGNGACLNVQFDHSPILWLTKVVQSSYTDC